MFNSGIKDDRRGRDSDAKKGDDSQSPAHASLW